MNVFISYSSRDSDTAQAVCQALEAAGLRCWIAPRNITPGQTWSEAIIDGINASEVMVLIYSEASNASPQVLREVERAVNKQLKLITFRIEDVAPTKAMEYMLSVSHWQQAHVGGLDAHLQMLVRSVQALLTPRTEATTPAAQTGADTGFVPPKPVALPPHNLPRQLTSFVGREETKEEIKQQLASAPLLTLVGSGGTGKTRLALKVGEEALPNYPQGVWLVRLEALPDPDLVDETVVSALGLQEEPGQSATETLINHLRHHRLLLILDNCEHLLTACAALAEALLASCHQLTMLVTSREPLRVMGEQVYRLPSLSLPSLQRIPPAEQLVQFEAVRLFVDRAVLVQPAFRVTDANARAIVQICHRLDGIPLALELAAARVKNLPVEQLNTRLEDRFKILTGGSRTALPRQQTLRALIDWSFDLLTEQEQQLLLRLSVFSGGWSLEAAEQVCTDEKIEDWEVLDILSTLADKSLVTWQEQGDQARYDLLATVRQYARDKLTETGGSEAAYDRHLNYYFQMVLGEQTPRNAQEEIARQDFLKREYDNIRAALDWALLHHHVEQAVEMCLALADLWETRRWFGEAHESLERCLSHREELPDLRKQAQLLWTAGWFHQLGGQYDRATEFQENSLALCREAGDQEGEANALNNLALIARASGDVSEARRLFTESLEIVRSLGDERKQAARLSNLGLLENEEGDYEKSREQLEAARVIYERHDDTQGLAACLCNLADMALHQKDWQEAERLSHQCYELFQRLEIQPGIAIALTNLAEAALLHNASVKADNFSQEALHLCVDIEMQELIPHLLELRAESQAQQEKYTSALFCLTAANILRECSAVSRLKSEQERVEALENQLSAVLSMEAGKELPGRIVKLSMSALVAEALQDTPS